jgi:hypothetical protein
MVVRKLVVVEMWGALSHTQETERMVGIWMGVLMEICRLSWKIASGEMQFGGAAVVAGHCPAAPMALPSHVRQIPQNGAPRSVYGRRLLPNKLPLSMSPSHALCVLSGWKWQRVRKGV